MRNVSAYHTQPENLCHVRAHKHTHTHPTHTQAQNYQTFKLLVKHKHTQRYALVEQTKVHTTITQIFHTHLPHFIEHLHKSYNITTDH